MKFTCNTKELSEACSNVMRAVSTKVTIPTIEGILMECGSDTLSLTGYDFEFGINTTLQASVVEPGAIVINAKVRLHLKSAVHLFQLSAVRRNITFQVLMQTIIRSFRPYREDILYF